MVILESYIAYNLLKRKKKPIIKRKDTSLSMRLAKKIYDTGGRKWTGTNQD